MSSFFEAINSGFRSVAEWVSGQQEVQEDSYPLDEFHQECAGWAFTEQDLQDAKDMLARLADEHPDEETALLQAYFKCQPPGEWLFGSTTPTTEGDCNLSKHDGVAENRSAEKP